MERLQCMSCVGQKAHSAPDMCHSHSMPPFHQTSTPLTRHERQSCHRAALQTWCPEQNAAELDWQDM